MALQYVEWLQLLTYANKKFRLFLTLHIILNIRHFLFDANFTDFVATLYFAVGGNTAT